MTAIEHKDAILVRNFIDSGADVNYHYQDSDFNDKISKYPYHNEFKLIKYIFSWKKDQTQILTQEMKVMKMAVF